VDIEPGESKNIELTLAPPEGREGLQDITILASSIGSYAKDSATVALDLLNCFEFEASLNPQIASTCVGRPSEYSIEIKNTGIKDDSYSISSAPFVKLPSETIEIAAGETGRVDAIAIPVLEGETEFDITVTPDGDADNAKKTSAQLLAMECKGVAVVTPSSELNVCRGETATAAFIIKNTGTLDDVFSISTNIGDPSADEVMLEPQEIRTVDISIKTEELEESNEVIVTVSSAKDVSDHGSFTLVVENCYDASISLSPESYTLCSMEEALYTVEVENTGERDDSYDLIFGDQKVRIDLSAGDSKEFSFIIPVVFEAGGDYRIIAALTSDHVDKVSESKITVKPFESCYSVGLEAGGGEITVMQGKAVTIPVTVKNSGESAAIYDISLEGPDWAYITPSVLELEPGESKDVFVYVSPPFDAEDGEYRLNVEAQSDFAGSEKEFTVLVGEAKAGDIVVIDKKPSEMEEGPSFLGGLRGITGALFSGSRSSLRLLIVGLIAAIIIIVLIVRFAMLFR